ncbi:hypothetical protein PLESTB_001473300 [Pleodorina starrii]|uniref:DNA2/NAM7 helicase-like C-terminal domain-containing protein n=1 Tax=Pleodorina starrii TaxID=330485 RepID=A0A9W6BVR3_9CHLO|nr:hypothetical protein PLESTM_000644700 [Pleodorina starrii]GLC59314.1 hypothetical protein PLESTB_001473300 [Pleodorina starrii]GLC74487.1 hypothetical protein PLESTF_001518000 [Pleodorina starrii]
MAASGPRTTAHEDVSAAAATKFLSVTEVASFVGLRQCGRYLRLSVSRSVLAAGSDAPSEPSLLAGNLDKALAAAGHQLEDEVATELGRRAPEAPHLPPRSSVPGAAPPVTPWEDFLDLLSQPPHAFRSDLGCWAAEVVLRGLPTADSVVSLSGRADFILLLWRSGRPVLRIVECKASTEPQTKFVVQLVLYRMMLLRLLSQTAAQSGRGRVVIGGREWSVPPGQAAGVPAAGSAAGGGGGGGGGGAGDLQVECLLRTKVSGAAGSAVDGVPLPPEEVESMTRQLSAILERGGRIAAALDPAIPLAQVPYELDSHCAACSRSKECWADSAARGAVQLSGCGASEAQRLAAAGVGDIEDLAALTAMPPPSRAILAALKAKAATAATASSSPRRRPQQLQHVAAAAGMSAPELQRLSLTAAVRVRRWLGQQSPQPQDRAVEPPWFQLLPGGPPSCLPGTALRACLVRVYLSVAVDAVLKRLVGIAAHVAAPTADGSAAPPPPPTQAAQTGWDVALLLEGVTLDGSCGAGVVSSDAELDVLEAAMLAMFSDQLCDAVQRCAEQLQQQQGPGQRQARAQGQGPPLLLHFYVHSHQEVRELIRRCTQLDGRHHSGTIDGGSGGGGASCSGPGLGGDGTCASSGCLSWLPHLLGLRAEIGDLLGQEGGAVDPPVQEQAMVSVMEDEVRRYATVWQGAGRLAASSIPWGGDGAVFDWDWRPAQPPQPPQPVAADAAAAEGGSRGAEHRRSGGSDGCDLRAVFSAGGYLDSLVRVDPPSLSRCVQALAGGDELWQRQQQHHHNHWAKHAAVAPPADPQPRRQRQPGTVHAALDDGEGPGLPLSPGPAMPAWSTAQQHGLGGYVQVRPDCPGAFIPPSFFRALWSSTNQGQLRPKGQHQPQRQPGEPGPGEPQRCRRNDAAEQEGAAADVFQRGAARLRQLLLAQAHAVRWLEERLVRLPGTGAGRAGGGNPRLRKAPLALPPPLGRSLRAFRLDVGHLPGGPRQAPQGPQAARASELARAALDAVWLNRGSELRAFWRKLGAQPPAARAAEERSGTVVLDRVQHMVQGKASWLRGRVAAPVGFDDWEALVAATGLQEGDGVVVTAAVGGDPWVCQDAVQAAGLYANAVIKRADVSTAAGNAGGEVSFGRGSPPHQTAEGGELWVDCRRDFIKYRANGLFLQGTKTLTRLTPEAGATQVVLDGAPNIAGWVASSAVECLQDFGGSSAYLAELWLPLSPAAEDEAAGGAEEEEWGRQLGAVAAGPHGVSPAEEPRTPVSVKSRRGGGPGGQDDCGSAGGGGAVTPVSVMGAQQLFSPAYSPSSPLPPGTHTPGCTRSPAAPGATSSASSSSWNVRGAGSATLTTGNVSDSATGLRQQQQLLRQDLDRDQVAAVRAFLAHPDSGSRVLLQGPPGTGKTETMATAVLAWLEQATRRGGPMGPPEQGGVVLLSGPTHPAIDNLLGRVATRLREVGGASMGHELRQRVKLVRLDSERKALAPGLKELGVLAKLPNQKDWDKRVWYVVGGTLRHLVKAAKELRTRVSLHAAATGKQLMDTSGRGAFAAALVLDEASMVFGPHLLALCCLLMTRGSLLVGGDHRQLSTIHSHDFSAELRPNLLRHRPHVSAYEYMRQLAACEARQRQQQQQAQQQQQGDGQIALTGGPPPPVSVCALSYTHRLPPALVTLIQPLYRKDGIVLRGRPPAAATTPAAPAVGSTSPTSRVTTIGSQTGAAQAGLNPRPAAAKARHLSPSRGISSGTEALRARDGGVWRRLWQRGAGDWEGGEGEGEGLFLVVHNEDRSHRLNPLEVQLVEKMLEARDWGREGGSHRPAAATGLIGGGGGRGATATGSSGGGGGDSMVVALITPHRAQRQALAALVEARDWGRHCRADTVEKWQGGEAETVIFCATASDAAALERAEEFYSSVCRANVAFSRARRRLIVVASRAFLTHLPAAYGRYAGLVLWRQLRCMCEVRGTHLGETHVTVSYSQQAQPPDAAVAAAAVAGASTAAEMAATGYTRQATCAVPGGTGVPSAQARGAPSAAASGQREDGSQVRGDVTYRCDVFQGAA